MAAPKTVNNFVFLANYHYYDGVIFHRIIKGFVIQGSDPTGAWPSTGYPVEEQLPARQYEVGSLASGPTRTRQPIFLISRPPGQPAAVLLFGKVVEAFDVVERCRASPPTAPTARTRTSS